MTPFAVLSADPAWRCKDQLPGPGRGASKHYQTMEWGEIAALLRENQRGVLTARMSGRSLPIADNALLALWRLGAMQVEALEVVKQWGFIAKSELVWAKYRPCKDCVKQWGWARGSGPGSPGGPTVTCELCEGTGCGTPWFGMGRYVRNSHESCIIAARGKMASRILDHSIPSILHAPVPWNHETNRAIHSAKPERFYTGILEKLAPGPYLEMFGRRRRAGWTVLGNQVGKIARTA